MLKKIVVGMLLAGLIGVLIYGAVNRTLAKAEGTAADAGRGVTRGNDLVARNGRSGAQQSTPLQSAGAPPDWAGAGRSAGKNAAGRDDAPGDGTGTGQAQVDAWLQIEGSVTSVSADQLVVQTLAGEQLVVENRPWWFAQEQGFAAQTGDNVILTGFYENNDFEAGQIANLTSGQTVAIRDESGRPLWAGRGRRGA
jgi:hypothetical protein